MKDKLEKTGLSRAHYRKQLALRISLFAVAFITVCALPIGLSYRVAEVVKAEKAEVTTSEENTSQVEEVSSFEEDIKSFAEK